MNHSLLSVNQLSVNIDSKEILKNLNLTIENGETHVLMGPNGAGKSTLGNALMGHPDYEITAGKVLFEGEDITDVSAHKRARKGMFLSFQNPLEIPGVTLESFIRNALYAINGKPVKVMEFKKELERNMELLNMNPDYAKRELNVGFSGGEKKKAEILQMLMLSPKLAILDETDSGLDIDAVKTVSRGIQEYQKKQGGALLVITHNAKILEHFQVNYTHVISDGKIVKTGDSSMISQIQEQGFEIFTGRKKGGAE